MVLIDWLVFLFYRYLALPPVIALAKIFQALLPSKLQEMVADRSSVNLQALPARPLWIHAASGEIEYAKSVIRALKEEFPQIPILVTYFSPSAKKLIQKFPGIDLGMALPWDRPSDIEKFLSFYNPRICLIARTDVWPEMTRALKKRQTPVVLFAATLATGSSRSGLLAGSLSRMAMNSLDAIYCVSEEDRENFESLGIHIPIHVAGDTRFDQVLHRLQNPLPVKNHLRPAGNEKILVCGSTWPEDEEILFEAFQTWISRGGRIVLAPHEVGPERIQQLQNWIQSQSWSFNLYSASESWNSHFLLVDQIGVLQELYTWGHLAFVGGSFKDKVHSVMEPLCVGIPVCVGPYHKNNREAQQFQFVILQTDLYAVNEIRSANDLSSVMDKVWELPKTNLAILKKVRSLSGSTEKLVDWVGQRLG